MATFGAYSRSGTLAAHFGAHDPLVAVQNTNQIGALEGVFDGGSTTIGAYSVFAYDILSKAPLPASGSPTIGAITSSGGGGITYPPSSNDSIIGAYDGGRTDIGGTIGAYPVITHHDSSISEQWNSIGALDGKAAYSGSMGAFGLFHYDPTTVATGGSASGAPSIQAITSTGAATNTQAPSTGGPLDYITHYYVHLLGGNH